MKKVREVMTDELVTVGKQSSIHECAVKMKEHNIGIVPVVEGRRLIGLVTDRDIVIRGIAEHRQETDIVENVMSEKLYTCEPDMPVEEVAKIMANEQIRRLPVVENGELIGIVAIGDLAVRDTSENEAGQALSRISEPVRS